MQTSLILAITPRENLERCYEQLQTRGAYFDSLFGEGACPDEEGIIPPWWPKDWWKQALDTVTEHYARISSARSSESSPLHRVYPPLTVRSLRPLFQLVLVDLEEANQKTGRQMIRVHLSLIGVRPMIAR